MVCETRMSRAPERIARSACGALGAVWRRAGTGTGVVCVASIEVLERSANRGPGRRSPPGQPRSTGPLGVVASLTRYGAASPTCRVLATETYRKAVCAVCVYCVWCVDLIYLLHNVIIQNVDAQTTLDRPRSSLESHDHTTVYSRPLATPPSPRQSSV